MPVEDQQFVPEVNTTEIAKPKTEFEAKPNREARSATSKAPSDPAAPAAEMTTSVAITSDATTTIATTSIATTAIPVEADIESDSELRNWSAGGTITVEPVGENTTAPAPLAFSAQITTPAGASQPKPDPEQPVLQAAALAANDKATYPIERDAETASSPDSANIADLSRTIAAIAPDAPQTDHDAGMGKPAEAVSVTETIRSAETQPAADAPKLPASAVQQIAVRIAGPEAQSVDLHVTERAGEIHVAVRTPDVELQSSLRQDLASLTSSLERAGYHAETFVPRVASGAQMNLRDERQAGGQGFSNRGGSQGEPGSGRQKRQQSSRSWLEELEQSR